MAIESYEIPILVGMMMLVVWYNTLPYDNVIFDLWNNNAKQPPTEKYNLQNPPNISGISKTTYQNNIGYVVEGFSKIVLYLAVPSLILYKMLTIVIRDLRYLRY